MANFSKPQSMLSMLVTLFTVFHFTAAFQHGANHHMHRRFDVDAAMSAQISHVAGALEQRQTQARIAVTGSCGPNAQSNDACNAAGRTAAARVEIRDLAQNADAWNLFLLGMEAFQAKDKNDVLSYYQIAGIHGRPYVSWNGYPTPLNNPAGYCPHAMSMFGTWHRPYLAVYEQGLYQSILEVIATFPQDQQSHLNDVATSLRIPYWDWASGDGVPSQISDQQVTVTKASGQVQIANPLYSYSWGTKLPDEMGGGPVNNWPATLRRPLAGSTPVSNDQNLNKIITSMQPSIRDRVYGIFATGQDWGFASTEAIGIKTADNSTDSFESIHDIIHSTFGGGDDGTGEMGHMGSLDYSAFDPAFWLHHANIDRLLAMYQLVTPNTWVANGNVNNPMAQWSVGESKDSSSPLKPFTKDTAGNYYSSDDIRETRILGYYYPETAQQSKNDVLSKVSTYAPYKQSLAKRVNDTTSSGGDKASASKFTGRPIQDGDYHTVFQIIAPKYAVKGSYTVHCYVGQQDGKNSTQVGSHTVSYSGKTATAPHGSQKTSSPYSNSTSQGSSSGEHYTQQPNYVGSYGILGHSMGSMGNSSVITSGSIPLTTCLQDKQASGELKSLTPDDIEPYLTKNLYYKVVGPDGEMDASKIQDFHVSVKCTPATPAPNEDSLPNFSAPFQPLPKCTENKPAGNPFTYQPTPLDIPLPNNATSSLIPGGQLPSQESGYCPATNKIVYVDLMGNVLSGMGMGM